MKNSFDQIGKKMHQKKSADARSRFLFLAINSEQGRQRAQDDDEYRHQTSPLLLVSFVAFSQILVFYHRFSRWVLLLLRVVPLLWKRRTTVFFFCFFAFPGGREKEQRGRFGADDGDVKSSESWK